MEIYLEKIRDLLARRCNCSMSCSRTHCHLAAQNDNLQVHEDKARGVYVKGLSDYYVSSSQEVYEIMRTGGNARVTSSTSALKVPVSNNPTHLA